MKERPILFNGEMVRAILEGKKTQTRRPIKPQPHSNTDVVRKLVDGPGWYAAIEAANEFGVGYVPFGSDYQHDWKSPFGEPGDRLWVRETFQPLFKDDLMISGNPDWGKIDYKTGEGYRIVYLATDPREEWINFDDWENTTDKAFPSIHMPRWASRITLEVERVWVERVQDITIEDIIAEGFSSRLREHDACVDLRMQWESAWDGIYSKTFPLKENPWAWACQFKVIKTEAKK